MRIRLNRKKFENFEIYLDFDFLTLLREVLKNILMIDRFSCFENIMKFKKISLFQLMEKKTDPEYEISR